MPRHPRIHFPGALYHVIVRGNDKKQIFMDNKDYHKYLLIAKDYLEVSEINVLAYALLPNHGHLLVEVNTVPLGKFMKMQQQKYTQYFNNKHKTYGHVFQGRYKALLVDKENYFTQLLCYIVYNAMKAGLEEKLGDYQWTSHYEILHNRQIIVSVQRLFQFFDDDPIKAKKRYFSLLGENIPDNGSDSFYLSGKALLNRNTIEKQVELDVDELVKLVAGLFQVNPEHIISGIRGRQVSGARRAFIYVARHLLQLPGNFVADYLGVSPQYVAKTYQEMNVGKSDEEKWFNTLKESLLNSLKVET